MIRRILVWIGRAVGLVSGGYLAYVAARGSRHLVRPLVRPLVPDVEGDPLHPGELGLPYEELRFRTDDGVELAGWLVPAARETRAAIVVMHGYSGHRLPELAATVPWLRERYHVLQFDFRGHGASDPAPVTMGATERHDVAAAVRLLADRGYGPIALVGVSMGGAIAIIAGAELPIAAVIADAPYADLDHPVASTLRDGRYPLPRLGARAILVGAWLRTRRRLPSPISAVARLAPRALLLIAPREDALIHWTQSRRLYAAAGEPKELYVVEGAGHGESHIVGGEEYRRRVLAFLERHLDGGMVLPGADTPDPGTGREQAGHRL